MVKAGQKYKAQWNENDYNSFCSGTIAEKDDFITLLPLYQSHHTLKESNFREEGFILTHGFRGLSPYALFIVGL